MENANSAGNLSPGYGIEKESSYEEKIDQPARLPKIRRKPCGRDHALALVAVCVFTAPAF